MDILDCVFLIILLLNISNFNTFCGVLRYARINPPTVKKANINYIHGLDGKSEMNFSICISDNCVSYKIYRIICSFLLKQPNLTFYNNNTKGLFNLPFILLSEAIIDIVIISESNWQYNMILKMAGVALLLIYIKQKKELLM